MKILVEHDEAGTLKGLILTPRGATGEGRAAPVRRPGQRCTEVDLPAELADLAKQLESGIPLVEAHVNELRALMMQFRIDVTQKPQRLVRKDHLSGRA
jgi:hypothetical protein